MGVSLAFMKISCKSENLKLGVLIAWTISIENKNSVDIVTCLEEFNILAPISQGSVISG